VLWRAQIRVDYWDEEIAAHAAARGLTVSDVVSEDEIVVTCTWETEVHRRAAPPCPPSPRSWVSGQAGAGRRSIRCAAAHALPTSQGLPVWQSMSRSRPASVPWTS
jgi:hypothetical protein